MCTSPSNHTKSISGCVLSTIFHSFDNVGHGGADVDRGARDILVAPELLCVFMWEVSLLFLGKAFCVCMR